MNDLPPGTFIVGNKLMSVCSDCEQIIRVDKPIFGSFHFCLNDEEKELKRMAQRQMNPKSYLGSAGSALAQKLLSSEGIDGK